MDNDIKCNPPSFEQKIDFTWILDRIYIEQLVTLGPNKMKEKCCKPLKENKNKNHKQIIGTVV